VASLKRKLLRLVVERVLFIDPSRRRPISWHLVEIAWATSSKFHPKVFEEDPAHLQSARIWRGAGFDTHHRRRGAVSVYFLSDTRRDNGDHEGHR